MTGIAGRGCRTSAALLLVVMVGTLVAGCQQPIYRVRYEVNITPAVVENDPPEDGPRTDQIAAEMSWSVTDSALEVHVTNRADTTAAIIWEGATIAYDRGEPVPLLCGSPVASPDLPQEPTVIPRKGQIALDLIPGPAAEWEWHPNRVMGGSWRASRDVLGIESPDSATEEDRLAAARQAVGRRLMVRIPIRIGSRLLTHSYEMRITGASTYRAQR